MILTMNPKEFTDLLQALVGLFAFLSVIGLIGYGWIFFYVQKQVNNWFGVDEKIDITQVKLIFLEWLGCMIRKHKSYKTFILYQDADIAYREAIRFFKIQASTLTETDPVYREELVVKLLKFEKNLHVNLPSMWAYPSVQQSVIKLWLSTVKKRILYLRSIDKLTNPDQSYSYHQKSSETPKPYVEPTKKSWRKVLGVTSLDTPLEEVKKKYKRLASIHHPDKGGDEEMFKEIKQAYDDAEAELKPSNN